MLRVLAVLVFLLAALPVRAEDDAKTRDIRAPIEMTKAAALGKQVMASVMATTLPLVRKAYPQLSQKALDLFQDEFAGGLDQYLPLMVDEIVKIYGAHFSHQEIKDLIAFYETETGSKVIRVLPQITQQSMAAGGAWGAEYGRLAMEKAMRRLRQEGYEL